ncbi:PEP-CTERM sorting domain-containing protein [Cerasicoccus fimbriatus]|uniref:PEP-CTERM sorting domain-containing protein n=1 Tax=Cerasicoccus fimbriatus TaxID=3014554 RepID=UPI0022B58431|nr:PEP-CTERM sorting domain-containing protein [Cerasicoccus sp. TK19100]
MKLSIPLLTSTLLLAAATSATATVLVFDDFGTDVTGALNGRTPTTGPNDWVGYSGSPGYGWQITDGAAGYGSLSSLNGMAGIELGANYFDTNPGIYELTVHYTLNSTVGTTWIGFGFAENFPTSSNSGLYQTGTSEGQPWAFMRNNGEINVRAGGAASSDLISQGGFDVTDFEYKLVLDTTVAQWTVDAFYNDTQLDLNGGAIGSTYTYTSGNPTSIGWVGVSASNNVSGTIQSITLEQVPEPQTYALLAGLGALTLAVYRRRR